MSPIASTARAGMSAAYSRFETAAGRIAGAAMRPTTVSTAAGAGSTPATDPLDDLATNLVAEKVAGNDFKANLRVLQTADAMLGTLLDTRA